MANGEKINAYFSYGEYFLYGGYDGAPVYQHFAGVEYLYRKDGNWLISDEIGLREAGLQNQVSYSRIGQSLGFNIDNLM